MRTCIVRDLGHMSYGKALQLQGDLAAERKLGFGTDHLLFVEHPHVITIGRNGHDENLLAPEDVVQRSGISLYRTDRGGDVTYHGPGQVVGYPIIDLREWKRDVGAYVRGIEQVLIDALYDFGIIGMRVSGLTGVWVSAPDTTEGIAKIAAIGIHLSRWVSTHGWALNVTTDLKYFQYIVPCGLQKPVASMESLGIQPDAGLVKSALAKHFAKIFDFELRFDLRTERELPGPALTGELK